MTSVRIEIVARRHDDIQPLKSIVTAIPINTYQVPLLVQVNTVQVPGLILNDLRVDCLGCCSGFTEIFKV